MLQKIKAAVKPLCTKIWGKASALTIKVWDKLPQRVKAVPKKAVSKIKALPKKQKIALGAGAGVLALIIISCISNLASGGREDASYETAKAEKRNIKRTVTVSSVVEANDQYSVTALVTGEILTDTFNEGDIVKKDDVLYTIESSDAQNAVEKARQNFTDAVKKRADTISANKINRQNTNDSVQKALNNLQTARTNYNNLTIRSDYTGIITEVLVKEGDSVNDGTKLARIEDTSRLKIQLPFNEADAGGIRAGDTAELTLAASADKLWGVVTGVSSASVATAAHAIVRYVTIEVKNPGALTAGESASAVIGNIACSDLGKFEYCTSGYITAKTNGKIGELYLSQNDYIKAGQTVGYITSDSVVNSFKNAQMELDGAYRNLEKLVIDSDTYALDSSVNSARISLEEAEENLEDYTIKAPIDGTIITKNKKAGEKLEHNSSSGEPMAVIYDMSVLKVQLTIDESNILDIKAGQKVMVTADAVKGMFEGEITKVGINGTSANGVTSYPVEVTIYEYGELLPGMNVDCSIEVEAAENVLSVPVSAIKRGSSVWIAGGKESDNDTAPDGYRSIPVKTGVSDSQYIEIKEGLNEGDEVVTTVNASGIEAQGQQQWQGHQQMGPMSMGGQRPSGGMGMGPR